MAVEHCQKEFKWDKWNCPESAFKSSSMDQTKEAAYINAIMVSGIAHAITKNCSRGEIKACKCNPKPQNLKLDSNMPVEHVGKAKNQHINAEEVEWTWGGCSDDTTYGIEFTKYIFNKTSQENAVKSHNYEIGRQVLQESMIKKCRCHGVSGSCSLQTCWVQIAPFHVISSKLKEKYGKALHIKEQQLTHEENNNTVQEIENPHKKNSLIYLEQSPDYCQANSTTGWVGTKGRSCSRILEKGTSLAEKRSCRHLCRSCGLKVRKRVRKVVSRCNCSFAWCCEVKCETCEQLVPEYVCE
ncbi:protein Wnt-8a-like isoform X2 [Aethina tumida]|nr:protein Wnt-8a-like isoform X2 [Aethina tumida]